MFPLAAYGPDIANAVLGGLIAGVVAFKLLRVTQKHEKALREDERARENERRREEGEQREAEAVRSRAEVLLLSIRDLSDLLISDNLVTVKRASTYTLRNQIAVAEFDMAGRPVMVKLRIYVDYARQFRDWVRRNDDATPYEWPGPLMTERAMHQRNIDRFAGLLEDHMVAEVRGQSLSIEYPELPPVASR